MRDRVRAYLELMRPANVVTAFADVLAGFAAATAGGIGFAASVASAAPPVWGDLLLLLAATAGLYAGGVVLNDVFDASVDAEERPERPIPSGRVSRQAAARLGAALLVAGIVAAAFVNALSLVLAVFIAAGAVAYDAAGKHHSVIGPINMGLCRGGNLLLGVSAVPVVVGNLWFLALIPVAYIGAVTAVSAGEVHGGRRATGTLAVSLVAVVTASLLALGLREDYRMATAIPFVAVFAALVIPPFVRAARTPTAAHVRRAVKIGVLSLVAMNAALAAGFGGWPAGVAVIALLPVSIGLARLFAVT